MTFTFFFICKAHLNLVWRVILRLPVWNSSHSTLSIPKLFTKPSILRLGMATAVRIMERHIEEERPFLFRRISLLLVALEELPNKELNLGDVPTHLQHGIGLFCVGEIEWVYRARTNVFFPDDSFPKKSNYELVKIRFFFTHFKC